MKQILRLLLACFCVTVGYQSTNSFAAPIFNPENGHYYEALRFGTPWEFARDDAASRSYLGLSGHLVTITSASENDFVYGSVYPAAFFASSSGTRFEWVWLGGFQLPGSIEPSGGWGWVTGESFSYSNWDPGQPSDTGGNPNGEHQDLLIMWSGGTWNDITGPAFGSGSVSGYIVEYEVVPEPSICALIAVGSILAARARRLLGESKPALNE